MKLPRPSSPDLRPFRMYLTFQLKQIIMPLLFPLFPNSLKLNRLNQVSQKLHQRIRHHPLLLRPLMPTFSIQPKLECLTLMGLVLDQYPPLLLEVVLRDTPTGTPGAGLQERPSRKKKKRRGNV